MTLILIVVGVAAVVGFSFGFFSGLVWSRIQEIHEEQEMRDHAAYLATLEAAEDDRTDGFAW